MRSRFRRLAWLTIPVILLAIALWYGTVYPRGMLMAQIDHARGRYEIKTYGLQFFFDDAPPLLETRYGVRKVAIASCGASPDVMWYAAGYNRVSVRLLTEKYGEQLLADCPELVGHLEQHERR